MLHKGVIKAGRTNICPEAALTGLCVYAAAFLSYSVNSQEVKCGSTGFLAVIIWSRCQSRVLLDPPVLISGLIGLCLVDSIPHCWCPPAGSGIAAATGTGTSQPQLWSAASTMDAQNMDHSDSMSPGRSSAGESS